MMVYGFTYEELLPLRRIVDEVGSVEKLKRLLDKDDLILENRELKSQIHKLEARLERINKLSEEL